MKPKFWLLSICLISLFLGEAAAFAEDLQLTVSELKLFPVTELRRVAVGDPEIADITVLSNNELMLIAKKAGTTNLIIWDGLGQRTFKIIVLEKDLEQVAQRIRQLLISSEIRGVKVKTEQDNVYVIGEVLSEGEVEKVRGVLTPFANVVNLVKLKERMPLVEIDVNVLEVGFDDEKNLGLNWSNQLPITYDEPAFVEGKLPKVWRVFYWTRSTVDARLNFLIEQDKARTLSNPKLVTISGKEASFLVGGEIPYVTVETYGRTKVEWKEYGVNLKIMPQVTVKNEIKTSIKAEVSDIDAANAVTYQGTEIPATKKRQVQTELFLNDGDTIFIAGLIKNEDSSNIDRLPWLSRVPILGELFKSTEFQNKRTELVISLTPRIIRAPADIDYASEMVQEALVPRQGRIAVDEGGLSPVVYYSHMVEDIIAGRVVYPDEARQAKQEGTVKIDLLLLSDGKLKEAKVMQSSGHSALDKAALDAVTTGSAYPAFPAELAQEELRLTVPVIFKSYVKKE